VNDLPPTEDNFSSGVKGLLAAQNQNFDFGYFFRLTVKTADHSQTLA